MIGFNALWETFWSELRIPSDFRDNWYLWSINQMAHTLLGMIATLFVSGISFWYHGEFVEKINLWLMVAVPYIVWELRQRGKVKFDSVEDFLFVCVYGSGTAIVMFDEVEVGSSDMISNLNLLVPVAVIFSVHILTGAFSRIYERAKYGTK